MTSTARTAWPPPNPARTAVWQDSCSASPSLPAKNWIYDGPSIGFVLKGWFDYCVEGQTKFVAPGAIVFGNEGDEFNVRHHDESGNTRLVVSLSSDVLDEVARETQKQLRFSTMALPPGPVATRMFALMQDIALAGDATSDLEFDLIQAALSAPLCGAAQTRIADVDRRRVTTAVRHMQACFAQSCTLSSLAELAQMSRYHFVRVFGAVMGQSPNQYLINTRVRAAASLLRSTSMPIADVALEVGFNDISHFYACFRAAFACTPRRWRMRPRH